VAHNLTMDDDPVTAIERLVSESLDAGHLPAGDALPGVKALDLWREEPNRAMLFWVDQAADLCGLGEPVRTTSSSSTSMGHGERLEGPAPPPNRGMSC
jgi:hypothetical protein